MNLPPPGKVLLIKPSSLGDVISGVPVLRGLRRTFPDARVAWMLTPACAGIVAGEPELDEVIEFDRRHFGRIGRSPKATRDFLAFCRALRRRRFDWVIDLQGLFRSAFLLRVSGAAVRAGFADARELAAVFYTHPVRVPPGHTIDRNIYLARRLGIDAQEEDLTLTVPDEAGQFVTSLLGGLGVAPGPYLAVAPGARWTSKLYPARHWHRVISELIDELPVVLLGSQAERQLCADLAEPFGGGAVNLAGETSLPQLAAVISSAAALVCCDSAANLIAPAVSTPSVTLIGPTRPERTGPYGPLATAVVAEVPCRGCLRRRCSHVTCMQTIDPAKVASAVRDALGRAARPAAAARGRP